jgi:hypothetical protein
MHAQRVRVGGGWLGLEMLGLTVKTSKVWYLGMRLQAASAAPRSPGGAATNQLPLPNCLCIHPCPPCLAAPALTLPPALLPCSYPFMTFMDVVNTTLDPKSAEKWDTATRSGTTTSLTCGPGTALSRLALVPMGSSGGPARAQHPSFSSPLCL